MHHILEFNTGAYFRVMVLTIKMYYLNTYL